MLLRLLPQPTLENPSPLTILFTLPLPSHPYISRSLPLPPALLAHRALCLQEDIDCPNVLLGEKSSWICGIIDDVTFSLPSLSITINFIDGSSTTLPISISCSAQLQRVVEEVQLSFTAPTTVPNSPRSSISSIASTSSASSSSAANPSTPRRTPSSLLLSLLSPLLPSSSTCSPPRPSLAAPPCAPARVHRRAARSLLVDTYRRYVLPLLKEQLPCSYFPWAVASETFRQMEEFSKVQSEINRIIDGCGINRDILDRRTANSSVSRIRSSSSSSLQSMSDDESDSDSTPSPITPSTSVFSTCASSPSSNSSRNLAVSPREFLLSIPPAHALPAKDQMAYSSQLARLTQIASRISQIKKLSMRYEREEGKRRWLEGLERGRLSDKSLRKAFSLGEYPKTLTAPSCFTSEVNRSSRLRQSYTVEDLERELDEESQLRHPAMMDISDSEEDEEEEGPITPPKSRCSSSIDRPLLSAVTTSIHVDVDGLRGTLPIQRPTLERKLALITPTPGLYSDEDEEEEEEDVISTPISLSPPSITKKLGAMDILPLPIPVPIPGVGVVNKKLLGHVSPEMGYEGQDELEEGNEGWRVYA
ncbi:hypothetical protein I204_00550 [Kwoniella mangroviensis CBS 8886]|uniref:uncharacterized protein n=1 Tax=Kwoniella mangroviensis CBS 8507 TaxID=1296122 RepID=UPI00080D05EE|nr:uncharacterized protein I203_07201 [Kwoniella mangroviensis CBS 8507]OCF63879.1 hypothetical protein I203_07201 [Kwoniella mangroviensis CBS 8507]OCF78609.1 hypothetical protein I204_00550 [Kwoniella mangroviensis CBS 8886]